MFKKRVIKGKFRPESDDSTNQGEDENDTSSDATAMNEIKLEQSLRKKRLGTEFSSDAEAVIASEKKYKSSVQRSIESTLGSQFESKPEDGLSSTMFSHEKIMEQYVNQKMGIHDESSKVVVKKNTQDDDLYRLPDEIKFASALENLGGNKNASKEAVGGDQFMSIGIAEVALPISFKLSNIEDTEESRRKSGIERQKKYEERSQRGNHYLDSGTADIPSTGTARFWTPSMSALTQQHEKDRMKSVESKSVIAGPSAEVANASNEVSNSTLSTGPVNGKKRMFSNDDHVMQRFKNNQRGRN